MDSNDITEETATALNLKKVIAYVRINDIALPRNRSSNDLPARAASAISDNAEDQIVNHNKNVGGQNKGASRQSAYLERIKSNGLTQLGVIIKDTPETRAAMLEIAKRTREKNNWEAVIKGEPCVLSLLNALENSQSQLLRIVDLEAQYENALPSILIHEKIIAATGYKKLLLKFAGF